MKILSLLAKNSWKIEPISIFQEFFVSNDKTFPVVYYFTWKIEFASIILRTVVAPLNGVLRWNIY